MGKSLRVDPLGGASGDMFLAALVDLGADASRIESSLRTLNLDERFRLRVEGEVNRGFSGICLKVQIKDGSEWVAPEAQQVSHQKGHHHHRHFGDIRDIIENSNLPSRVVKRAVAVFRVLAESEGKVHGKEPEEVHFHEVGAVDSIVDIVGCCLALEELDIDEVFVTAVGVAQGSVKCAHGVLPLPAPATQLILEGCPVVFHPEEKELCTPTGAALLRALGSFEPPKGSWVARGVGMGLSHRTPKVAPPFLRMTLLEKVQTEEGELFQRDEIYKLSFDIDDMSAEYLAPIKADLMESGALDVASLSLNMKKGRLGCEVRVLCREQEKDRLLDGILKHSSTFGVRIEKVERAVLAREMREVETEWGKVRVKVSTSERYPKEHIEMEDVVALARKEGLRLDDVLEKVREALRG